MFALDLFNNDHERRLAEGAVDKLEQRRIDDLAMKMDDLVARARTATPEVKQALMKEFQKYKAERDGYFKINTEEAGIPGNVPADKIPGKEDLLKGKGRSYYEDEETEDDDLRGRIENSTYDLVGYLKDIIDGDIPSADNILDSLNDAYGYDSDASEAELAKDQVATAVRKVASAVHEALDGGNEDLSKFMPMIKKAYQFAATNGYGQNNVNEGSMKHAMHKDAERMSREQFCSKWGDENCEFWDNISGDLDEGVDNPLFAKLAPYADKIADTCEELAQGLKNGDYFYGDSNQDKKAARAVYTVGQLFRQDIKKGLQAIGKKLPADLSEPLIGEIKQRLKIDLGKAYNKAFPDAGVYFEDDKAGIPGSVPADKIPGKEDLLKGKGRQTYEADQKKNLNLSKGVIPTEPLPEAGGGWALDPKTRLELKKRKERQKTIAKWAGKPVDSTTPVKEHGGGIGPKQRWQDLMQERKLSVGDPIIVTAPNEYEGTTGEIAEFSPSGKFVIVNLYNHGEQSMHLSDVAYNQYADDEDADEYGEYEDDLNEFAPSPERDEDEVPDQILRLANRWWNATDDQPKITNVLRSLGWSIAQVESEDDAVQMQHDDGTTYFISADDFDPDVFEDQQAGNPKLAALIKNIQARIPKKTVNDPATMKRVAQMVAQADPTVQDAMATAQQLVQQYGQGAPAPTATNVNDLKSAARRGVVNAPYPKTSAGTPGYAQQHATFEGWQDFNKVEPYAVCLAGKPVKKFDYYEEARRFHDNWKKKLYREGNKEKADKITLLPLGLDETKEKELPQWKKDWYAKQKPNSWPKHPQPYHNPNWIDELPPEDLAALTGRKVKEAETDYSKRRQRERDVDAGKPVARQRQSKMTDYQKRRAQDKKDMALGEDQDTNGVERAILNRIMVAHTDLLMKFGPEKVMQAVEEVAYNVGDVDEIGTSDVSAYVYQVKQILGAE